MALLNPFVLQKGAVDHIFLQANLKKILPRRSLPWTRDTIKCIGMKHSGCMDRERRGEALVIKIERFGT